MLDPTTAQLLADACLTDQDVRDFVSFATADQAVWDACVEQVRALRR